MSYLGDALMGPSCAQEFVSLLSTLLIFQGGMVWTVTEDPGGSLGAAIEKMSIAMVTATCVMALAVEVRVVRERHHDDCEVDRTEEKEFDSVEEANPVHEPADMVDCN